VWINGQLYYLELDRGTMSYTQISARYAKYKACPHVVLWICSNRDRLEGMRARAAQLRHTALFSTLSEAICSPHGAIWQDHSANRFFIENRERLPTSQE